MNSTDTTIDNYQIIKTLGTGFSAKVKLAIDTTDEKTSDYALKIFDLSQGKETKLYLMNKEVEAVQKLNHKHVAKHFNSDKNSIMTKSSGKTVPVAYIA